MVADAVLSVVVGVGDVRARVVVRGLNHTSSIGLYIALIADAIGSVVVAVGDPLARV